VGLVAAFAVPFAAAGADAPRRPNIVIILADDMGFADMGSFGGEIRTPNLDALAKNGVRFTNFYTHASCSPTRSMLLSGVDTHVNGLGNMDEWTAPNQTGVPGYEGFLNKRVVTMPQLLKAAGYHTYMVGKWHLGKQPDQIPAARGFERDFTLLDGGGSYWGDMKNAVLRLRRAPGAARPVPLAEGLAQPARRRIRQGLGRGASGAAEAAGRDGHHAGRHRAC
jgi:arylsulfatase